MTNEYEVTFSTRLKRPEIIRIGIVAACAVVLLISAAVTMAASPSGSPGANSPAAGQANPAPGAQDPGGNGRRAFGGMGMGPWMNGKGMPGMPGFGIGRGEIGRGQITITAINGSNLSLKTEDGWTRTITVTSPTRITKGGQTIGVADLKVGDTIRFSETRNSDGSYTINAIDVVLPHVVGTVAGVTDSGFTVKSPDGSTWTITVNGSTTYNLGKQSGSKSDVKAGDDVLVEGTQTGTNAMTASSVRVAPAVVFGQVTAKTGSTITVKTPDGTTSTIHVGTGTTYQAPGVTNPGLSNVTVGSMVAAEGTRNADGSLNATVVRTGPGMGKGMGPGMGRGWGVGPKGPGAPSTSGSSSEGSFNQG